MEDKNKTSQKFIVKLSATKKDSLKAQRARDRVSSFQEDIINAGRLEDIIDTKKLILELKSTGKLPPKFKGFRSSEMTIAANFNSKSIEAVEVFKKTYQSKVLNDAQKEQFYAAGFVMSAMEDLEPVRFSYLQEANLYPEIYIDETPSNTQTAPPNSFLISSEDNDLNLVFQEVKGRVVGAVEERVKKFATDSLKKGGKKIAKSLGKKAVKKGAQVAVQAGIKAAAVGGVEAAAGVATGGVALLVAAALKLLDKVKEKIKHYAKRFLRWVTGEDDVRKPVAIAALGLGAIFLTIGMVIPAIIAGAVFLGSTASLVAGQAVVLSMIGIVQLMALGLLQAITAIIGPIMYSLVIAVFSFSFILFIINSGAYVVPQGGFGARPPRHVVNPYIDVLKLAESSNPSRDPSTRLQYENSNIPFTVTYKITITALSGALTNVSINYVCNVNKNVNPPNCPPDPTIPPPQGGLISPVDPYTFEYTQTYNSSSFRDSLITDIITVTADAPDAEAQMAIGSAGICIGDCPDECPAIWPTKSGKVTQGQDSPYSHSLVEAIDIGKVNLLPVYSTHGGTVRVENDTCEGRVVNIDSTCNGEQFSSRYSHLGSIAVTTGQVVTMDQIIGTVNNTGSKYCTTGAHLHYEFRGDLRMETPWIPKPILPSRSCCDNDCGFGTVDCTTTIP